MTSILFLSSPDEDCCQSPKSKRKVDSGEANPPSKRVRISKIPIEKVLYEGVDLEVDDVEFLDIDERMNTVSAKATESG